MRKLVAVFITLVACVVFFQSKAFALEQNNSNIQYQSHIESIGWQSMKNQGEVSGTEGQGLRMEAFILKSNNLPNGATVRYQAHVQNIGWTPWVGDGQVSGTTGRALRMEALKIELVGAPQGYHIEYKAHVQNIGWMPWVRDGAIAGTTGRALRIEAIVIRIVSDMQITYKTHIQNYGWTGLTSQGATSGNPGSGLRVEALQMNLVNGNGMQLSFQTHVQNIGWTSWVQSGQTSGTVGQSLRVEGFRAKLGGDTKNYHVIYRSYVQGIGWQSWVKDGEISGIVGQSRRIEAIQVKIVATDNINSIVKPKIAIDMGHNANFDSGANGIRFEDNLTKEVGTRVMNKLMELGYNVVPVNPMNPQGTMSTVDSLQQRTNAANANEVNKYVSIHFNAFNGSANGSEVYYSKSGSAPLAQNILNELVSLGFANRGIKDGSNLYVIKNTNAPAVLVECCFVDSQIDMQIYNADNTANAIVRGIIK